MEKSTAGTVIYVAEIDRQHQHFLARIRHWETLSAAFDEDQILIKGFTRAEMLSSDLRGIPFIRLYKLSGILLFPFESELPQKKISSALLWTPISRAFPVSLPKSNHHFFGIDHKVDFKLIPSTNAFEPYALLIERDILTETMKALPKARFDALSWIVFENRALVMGAPLLPIDGTAFYKTGDFIFPCGFAPEFPVMHKISAELLNPDGSCFVFFHTPLRYTLLPKQDFRSLGRSSVNLTFSS